MIRQEPHVSILFLAIIIHLVDGLEQKHMISVNQLTGARTFILNGDKNGLEHREEITRASYTQVFEARGAVF